MKYYIVETQTFTPVHDFNSLGDAQAQEYFKKWLIENNQLTPYTLLAAIANGVVTVETVAKLS